MRKNPATSQATDAEIEAVDSGEVFRLSIWRSEHIVARRSEKRKRLKGQQRCDMYQLAQTVMTTSDHSSGTHHVFVCALNFFGDFKELIYIIT